ncbi:MAG: hypothetical protein V5A38_09955 [Halolamina sp.]|jgi:hypothetical protein|uniref:hypothetical protein n=1 Tax=Halolamina sp. TaxID=1940283 RepID=UPI002FC36723
MQSNINTIDKAAMLVSGGLILLGIVVLGLVETLAGKPYGAAPMVNDAGEVVATPLIDPALRTGLVILGLMVLLLWGLYRYTLTPMGEAEPSAAEMPAD